MAKQTIALNEAEKYAINSVTNQINALRNEREALIRSVMADKGLPVNMPYALAPEGLVVGEDDEPQKGD